MKPFSRSLYNSLGVPSLGVPIWRPNRLFVVLALGASIFSGCGKSTSEPVSTSASSSSWSELARRWWQAARESVSVAERRLPQKTVEESVSQAEIERLEKLHPAWKMAQALEKSAGMTVQFQEVRSAASQRLNALAAPHFDIDFPVVSKAVPYARETASFLPSPAGEEVQLKNYSPDPTRLQQLQNEARQQQQHSFAQFLQEVNARQRTWQQEYREILESALQERVDAAAQRVPETVALVLPDPAMQLEMTNLRLQLLSNLFTTPAERRAARERLTELLAQWRAVLHEQELARASQLRELRVEEPVRLREEGRALLETTLARIRETERQNRQVALAEHQKLLEEEFGSKTARLLPVSPINPILQVGLPTSDKVSVSEEVSSSISEQGLEMPSLKGLFFLRTGSGHLPSKTPLSAISASSSSVRKSNAEQIRALRQLARRDAIRQAKTAARLKNAMLHD